MTVISTCSLNYTTGLELKIQTSDCPDLTFTPSCTQPWIHRWVPTWTSGLCVPRWVLPASDSSLWAARSSPWWRTAPGTAAHRGSSAWRRGASASPCRWWSSSWMLLVSTAASLCPGTTSPSHALPSPPSCKFRCSWCSTLPLCHPPTTQMFLMRWDN